MTEERCLFTEGAKEGKEGSVPVQKCLGVVTDGVVTLPEKEKDAWVGYSP